MPWAFQPTRWAPERALGGLALAIVCTGQPIDHERPDLPAVTRHRILPVADQGASVDDRPPAWPA